MRDEGLLTAGVAAGISFCLLCACVGGLLPTQSLLLTYSETFSDLWAVRDLFLQTANLSLALNPPRVDHVGFHGWDDPDDIRARGLPSSLNASAPANGSLLHQLMRVSWCSSGPARGDFLPARRNAGCACIAEAYLAVARENASFIPVPLRERAANQALRCWDRPLVSRSRHCGRVCTTHVASLALFANVVLFLTCMAFVAFRTFPWHAYAIKLFVAMLGVLLAIVFVVRDAEANALTLGGLAVCVFYLTVTLHEELVHGREDGPPPLLAALATTLPLVLSAHAIQLGVSGYGRDVWAFCSFGLCGGLLGLVLQRQVWLAHHHDRNVHQFVARVALWLAYGGLLLLLILLYAGYYFAESPYVGGSVGLFLAYQLFLLFLPFLLDGAHREMTWRHMTLVVSVLVANGGMTLAALVDAL